MSNVAKIPANWVAVCGFEVEEKLTEKGDYRKVAKNLGIAPKVFSKASAEKLIAAYNSKGIDLDETLIVTGKNSQNNSKLGPFVRKLAEYSEQNGYLTVADFVKAGGNLSGLTPSKNNKIFTRIVATLMKNGCFIEKSKGPKGEVIENPVDLDSLDLF